MYQENCLLCRKYTLKINDGNSRWLFYLCLLLIETTPERHQFKFFYIFSVNFEDTTNELPNSNEYLSDGSTKERGDFKYTSNKWKLLNPLMTNVPVTQKPVSWFTLQIDWLFSTDANLIVYPFHATDLSISPENVRKPGGIEKNQWHRMG